MKVLLVHNYYQTISPSGENLVFKAEKRLLEANGIKVITFEKYNDEILRFPSYKKLILPFRLLWSRETYLKLKRLIKKEKPDIVHFHNIFYLISPSAYYACKELDIPVVQTLHNFRFFCVNGLLMRNGKVCEECIGKLPWRGMVYGCYKDSKLYSIPIALMEIFHKLIKTWKNKVDAFIALSEFGKKKFIECGLSKEKIFVKPNFFPNPPQPVYFHSNYIVFIGRLSFEKGINTMLEAFKLLQSLHSGFFSLKIIGDGPLRNYFENKINTEKINNVDFIGIKTFSDCIEFLKKARFILMPSICYESFPMVIREAFACGKPVVASNLGAMAEIIEDGKTGLLFEPGNSEDLAKKIKWMIENEDACVEMGKNARRVFEEKYTAEKNYEILMSIYNSIMK